MFENNAKKVAEEAWYKNFYEEMITEAKVLNLTAWFYDEVQAMDSCHGYFLHNQGSRTLEQIVSAIRS